ncbi:MAG: hypothetical protein PHX93_03125 [Candidatus Peribacteraceae bacterium]|jgi:hypothetical protein|nr:hypothetical protein [Candidatus Peribacteraceae bacterium]
MYPDDDNNGKPTPPPEAPLPEEDDSNLGDDFTKVGEGKDLTNDQQ